MGVIDQAVRRARRTRFAGPLGTLMGLSAAFLIYAMPGLLIGAAIDAIGLGALLPLGARARAAMMIAAGCVAGGAVYALFRWLERPRGGMRPRQALLADVADAAGDADVPDVAPMPVGETVAAPVFSETEVAPSPRRALLARLRKRPAPVADGALTLRRADAHPDAPVRRPISAGADLGAPFDAIEPGWTPDAGWTSAEAVAPEPAEHATPAEPVAPPEPVATTAEAPPSPVTPAASPRRTPIRDRDSTADLMARLERALAARPGRPTSPPQVGAALQESMRELRRSSRR